MVDLIRSGKAPEVICRKGAEGSLPVPVAEQIEILFLLTDSPEVDLRTRALDTLKGWKREEVTRVLADPQTPHDVLRLATVQVLGGREEFREVLLANAALSITFHNLLLRKTSIQPAARPVTAQPAAPKPAESEPLPAPPPPTPAPKAVKEEALQPEPAPAPPPEPSSPPAVAPVTVEPSASKAEVSEPLLAPSPPPPAPAVVKEEPLQPEPAPVPPPEPPSPASPAAEPPSMSEEEILAKLAAGAKIEDITGEHSEAPPEVTKRDDELTQMERETLIQKIGRMSVVEKIKSAITGNLETRNILIRDSNKIISRAVLQSPKISDTEAEGYAAAKNVSEEVLRLISMNRKFMKSYVVMRALVNNPRAPIDITMPMINRLNDRDLKGLSLNRNVPEVIRSMAIKAIKQKEEATKPKLPGKH